MNFYTRCQSGVFLTLSTYWAVSMRHAPLTAGIVTPSCLFIHTFPEEITKDWNNIPLYLI